MEALPAPYSTVTIIQPLFPHVKIDLPEEIALRILSFLNWFDLIHKASLTCRSWRRLALDCELWKITFSFLQTFKTPAENLQEKEIQRIFRLNKQLLNDGFFLTGEKLEFSNAKILDFQISNQILTCSTDSPHGYFFYDLTSSDFKQLCTIQERYTCVFNDKWLVEYPEKEASFLNLRTNGTIFSPIELTESLDLYHYRLYGDFLIVDERSPSETLLRIFHLHDASYLEFLDSHAWHFSPEPNPSLFIWQFNQKQICQFGLSNHNALEIAHFPCDTEIEQLTASPKYLAAKSVEGIHVWNLFSLNKIFLPYPEIEDFIIQGSRLIIFANFHFSIYCCETGKCLFTLATADLQFKQTILDRPQWALYGNLLFFNSLQGTLQIIDLLSDKCLCTTFAWENQFYKFEFVAKTQILYGLHKNGIYKYQFKPQKSQSL
ncbi:F-box protein [Parachlamydia acanthamoebae]|jgi:hypothetical protein|uniref:F-box protein n=1 Tax=Parachlamydia acanthamoebae TaxID=83552 RepID=UPI0001C1742F|nr:F-box protein [Parachlamydia acanthamoebae]EFB40861.1 hypothetical protein pah_c180o048 [Parachlamydia acanthamoebae str. Hall's coccus]